MASIEVVVDSSGNSVIKTIGITGADCRSASRVLELALGVVTREELTLEYHQSAINEQLTQTEGMSSLSQ